MLNAGHFLFTYLKVYRNRYCGLESVLTSIFEIRVARLSSVVVSRRHPMGRCAINNPRGGDKITALDRSSKYGFPDAVALLLHYRADANLCRTDGSSPLHGAAEGGHAECCRVLLGGRAITWFKINENMHKSHPTNATRRRTI